MRQLKTIILMSAMLLIFTACSTNAPELSRPKNKDINKIPSENTVNNTKKDEGNKRKENLENSTAENNTQDNKDKKEKEGSVSKKDTGLVVKSQNTVSSQDKEAILKELDEELSNLFKDIDKMEELKDDDTDIQ